MSVHTWACIYMTLAYHTMLLTSTWQASAYLGQQAPGLGGPGVICIVKGALVPLILLKLEDAVHPAVSGILHALQAWMGNRKQRRG